MRQRRFGFMIDYPQRDAQLAARLEQIIREQDCGIADVLRYWPAYVQRRTLPRFLAHYELFKMVAAVPGCIVELGVFRGSGFFTWANLLETFCPNDRGKKVYGFDHFEGLRPEHFQDEKDGPRDGRDGKKDCGYKTPAEQIRALAKLHNDDNLLPGIERCVLVEGDIYDTVPGFITANPGFRISLLYFDLDLYGPTLFCLEKLYPLVVPGGIVCFDEYGLVPWEGETRAVEEYFAEHMPKLSRISFSASPSAWFVKE